MLRYKSFGKQANLQCFILEAFVETFKMCISVSRICVSVGQLNLLEYVDLDATQLKLVRLLSRRNLIPDQLTQMTVIKFWMCTDS